MPKVALVLIATFGGGYISRYIQNNYFNQKDIRNLSYKLHFHDISNQLIPPFYYQVPNTISKQRLKFVFGPGVAVADFNGDHRMDFIIPNSDGGLDLYLNTGNGQFKLADESWGLSHLSDSDSDSLMLSPVIYDYLNNNRPSLFVAGLGCSKLLRHDGDHFTDVSKNSEIIDCKNSQSAVPIQFNGKDQVDLFIIRYFNDSNVFDQSHKNFLHENRFNAKNGGQSSLIKNLGNGNFKNITSSKGITSTPWSLDAGWANLDGENNYLYLANDFGPDSLYRMTDDGFIDASKSLGFPDRRLGMNVSFIDLDGSGIPYTFVTNVYYPRYEEFGNFLWKYDSSKKQFTDHARDLGLHNCLWAFGVAAGDFDLDGNQEMYVANGFITNKKANQGSDPTAYMQGIYASFPGILTSRDDTHLGISHLGQNQVDCLFSSNQQQNHFTDYATESGIIDPNDDRAVAMIDTENNGRLDLIVTSRKGSIHFLKNNTPLSDHWVGFQLNPLYRSIGTKIEIIQNNRKFYRWNTGGKSGFMAYSDPRIHFGLPNNTPVDLNIYWNNKKVSHLTQLKTGKYYEINRP